VFPTHDSKTALDACAAAVAQAQAAGNVEQKAVGQLAGGRALRFDAAGRRDSGGEQLE